MQDKIRISVVSYSNSKPFIHGLKGSEYIKEHAVLSLDNPAACAEKVLSGAADLGLVPVAILPQMKEYHFASNYCIGAKGPVKSVMLFSEVPLNQIKRIIMDPESRTSVALAKILSKNFWKINPEWVLAPKDYISQISGHTAGIVIGDRSFELGDKFPYSYDLGTEWMTYTGLPFVFACWISAKPLDPAFKIQFERALEEGLKNIETVIEEVEKNYQGKFDYRSYIQQYITFYLDQNKKAGLDLFLRLLKSN